jgi:phospholipid/cholesterol/gamma-HCH transport system permease protein
MIEGARASDDAGTGPSPAPLLAWLGKSIRVRVRFALQLMAFANGVVIEALARGAWRRSVKSEFTRVLCAALLGGLPATIFVAALVGIGMVYQSIYWLRIAGQEDLIGTVLVVVLFREVAPILVGIILLGRCGSAMLAELCQLHSDYQLHTLRAQGIDPFQFLVMPRGIAFALAAYTLGIIFVAVTLIVGFVIASLVGSIQTSIWSFLDDVLRAGAASDYVLFPLKMLLIGLLIGASACLTGLNASPEERTGQLISRGFIRGMLALLLTSGLLSLAA